MATSYLLNVVEADQGDSSVASVVASFKSLSKQQQETAFEQIYLLSREYRPLARSFPESDSSNLKIAEELEGGYFVNKLNSNLNFAEIDALKQEFMEKVIEGFFDASTPVLYYSAPYLHSPFFKHVENNPCIMWAQLCKKYLHWTEIEEMDFFSQMNGGFSSQFGKVFKKLKKKAEDDGKKIYVSIVDGSHRHLSRSDPLDSLLPGKKRPQTLSGDDKYFRAKRAGFGRLSWVEVMLMKIKSNKYVFPLCWIMVLILLAIFLP